MYYVYKSSLDQGQQVAHRRSGSTHPHFAMHKDSTVIVAGLIDKFVCLFPVRHQIGILYIIQRHVEVIEDIGEKVVDLFGDVDDISDTDLLQFLYVAGIPFWSEIDMIKDFTGGLKLTKDENHRFANEIPKWDKIDIHFLSQALT